MERSSMIMAHGTRLQWCLQRLRDEVSPNLDGVIAPGLLIEIGYFGVVDELLEFTDSDLDDYANRLLDTVRTEGQHHANPYHNYSHFLEVHDRALQLVTMAKTTEEKFAVRFASYGHDYNHTGKKPVAVVNIKQIVDLYQGGYGEDAIHEAYDFMIYRDNELIAEGNGMLPEEKKLSLRTSFSKAGDIRLTPEEISALYCDAWLATWVVKYASSMPVKVRALINSLIKATDFVNKRNYPKTPMEWQFKMADMANFLKPLSEWLRTSVRVAQESTWAPPTSVQQYISGELFFLKTMVKGAILDNQETTGHFHWDVHRELGRKVSYLEGLNSEIGEVARRVKDVSEISSDLKSLREIVAPLFQPPLF